MIFLSRKHATMIFAVLTPNGYPIIMVRIIWSDNV